MGYMQDHCRTHTLPLLHVAGDQAHLLSYSTIEFWGTTPDMNQQASSYVLECLTYLTKCSVAPR